MTNCPHCGGELQITASGRGSGWKLGTGRGSWNVYRMKSYHSAPPFGSEALPITGELVEATRQEPVARPTVQSDLVVPLGIAGISGILAGLLSWALAIGAIISGVLAVPLSWTLAIGLIVGLLVTAAIWAVAVIAGRRLLWLTETISGRDLDQNGAVGSPPLLQVEITTTDSQGKRKMRLLGLPTTEDRLELLCRGILGGRPLSQAEWTGQGRPFSRNEFEQILGELEKAGLIRWRDPENRAQGREATASGRAFCKSIVYPKK